jgi:uncharacterized membrane protein
MTESRDLADGPSPSATKSIGRSITSGVLIGIGVAGFIDETVFHQLLHWHHFYDKSTATVGLVSDGVLPRRQLAVHRRRDLPVR